MEVAPLDVHILTTFPPPFSFDPCSFLQPPFTTPLLHNI
jgi:hypothetical protein